MKKSVWLEEDTAKLLNEVRGLILVKDSSFKSTDNNVIKKALVKCKELYKNG